MKMKLSKFSQLDIKKELINALNAINIVDLKPIQQQCIPTCLNGIDIMASAKTGSGKTLAFLVPLVEKVLELKLDKKLGPSGVIISPTRELAEQTLNVLNQLIVNTMLNAKLLIGGTNKGEDIKAIKKGTDIVVATPGRLHDLMKTLPEKFKYVEFLVIDEADKLMDQGFYEKMEQIISSLPQDKRQTMLFSATLNVDEEKMRSGVFTGSATEVKIMKLASFSLRKNFKLVDLVNEEIKTYEIALKTNEKLTQKFIFVESFDKIYFLYHLLLKNKDKKIIVFMATVAQVEFYTKMLQMENDIQVFQLSGGLNQNQRSQNLDGFRNSKKSVLVCTDLASRGLDIDDIDIVINYDPPELVETYLHRVGRTARNERSGMCYTILMYDQGKFAAKLEDKFVVNNFEKGLYLMNSTELEQMIKKFKKLQKKVKSNEELTKLAENAVEAYLKTYVTYTSECFIYDKLPEDHYKSFFLDSLKDELIAVKNSHKHKKSLNSKLKKVKEESSEDEEIIEDATDDEDIAKCTEFLEKYIQGENISDMVEEKTVKINNTENKVVEEESSDEDEEEEEGEYNFSILANQFREKYLEIKEIEAEKEKKATKTEVNGGLQLDDDLECLNPMERLRRQLTDPRKPHPMKANIKSKRQEKRQEQEMRKYEKNIKMCDSVKALKEENPKLAKLLEDDNFDPLANEDLIREMCENEDDMDEDCMPEEKVSKRKRKMKRKLEEKQKFSTKNNFENVTFKETAADIKKREKKYQKKYGLVKLKNPNASNVYDPKIHKMGFTEWFFSTHDVYGDSLVGTNKDVVPFKFKVREVKSLNLGLTAEEILFTDEKKLNQFVPMKILKKAIDSNEEQRLEKRYNTEKYKRLKEKYLNNDEIQATEILDDKVSQENIEGSRKRKRHSNTDENKAKFKKTKRNTTSGKQNGGSVPKFNDRFAELGIKNSLHLKALTKDKK